MKEEVAKKADSMSMSYDKIFKELSKLEKDFRHQETQLKIQSEEVDKGTTTNVILKEHLENAYAEIETLRNQIQDMETKVSEIETASNLEKEFCEQVVQKLTAKVTLMTSEHDEALEKCDEILNQTRSELTHEHENIINELQKQHAEEILRLEQQIEQETNHSRQLQTKLDFSMEDNLLLQDKLRHLNQELMPIESYKTQIKSLGNTNEKLKTQLLTAKNECQTLHAENAHLQKHNERLNTFVTNYNEHAKQQEIQYLEQTAVLEKTQTEFNEQVVKCELIADECNDLKEEHSKLKQEMTNLMATFQEDYCNIQEHRISIEQNRVLQELVKEMRKERLNCIGDQPTKESCRLNLSDTEERIRRLEELIHELKKVLVGNNHFHRHCTALHRKNRTK